jgi:LPS export ABC transporter protein LptC
MRRWILFFLFVLLGMEILTIAPKRLGNKEETKKEKVVKQEPSSITTTAQVMRGVRLVETGKGGKEWELEANYAQGYKEKGAWKMQGVTTKYFGEGENIYKVTGDSGVIELESKDMEIMGNVLMETSEGYTMKTNSVKFNSKTRQLSTKDHVSIRGPKKDGKFELEANGFSADMHTNVMDLQSDVKALREVTKDKDMNIKSATAQIQGKNGIARFKKDVEVDLEGVRMTGSIADFIYDQKTKTLKSLVMQNDVRVTDQEHFSSSDKAQVIFDKNEFILSGNPRVIQNDNELRGEEIHLLNGGKEVRVLRARARVENEKGAL